MSGHMNVLCVCGDHIEDATPEEGSQFMRDHLDCEPAPAPPLQPRRVCARHAGGRSQA